MENVYAVQCENLRIANMAFQAGSYDVAYEMLEALVHFVVSDEANKHIGMENLRSLREGVKLAVSNFASCKDEAYWEMSAELYDLFS